MKIAIRADGSNVIGMGHVYNSLAVADVLREKGAKVYFITKDYGAAIQKFQERGYPVEKIPADPEEKENFDETIKILEKKQTTFLITDLLEIHRDCSPALRDKGIKCISFDVLGKISLQSDIIFNRTTLKKRFVNYQKNDYTTYYLGPKYVPLAKQYWGLGKKVRKIKPKIENVLVCLGGGDEFNITSRVAKILDSFPVEATIVLGRAFKGEPELRDTINSMKKKPVIMKDISNMAEIMQQSDIAICAGGSILYELAITGTPGLIIPMNDHQVENGEEFQNLGSIITVGMHNHVSDEAIKEQIKKLEDYDLRRKMSETGKKIIDGKGAERAAAIILEFMRKHD